MTEMLQTLLFVPASNSRALDKIQSMTADAFILDLEDAVADDQKDTARLALVDRFQQGAFEGKTVAVRINALDTAYAAADIDALMACGPAALVIPKAEPGAPLEAAAQSLIATPLWLMIETPRAVLAAAEMARMDGVAALLAGTNDLALEARLPASKERAGLQTALQMMVLAARAAGVAVYDGVYNDFSDHAGFETECRQGKGWGFDGKTLIHPSQIDAAAAVFAPGAEEIARARRMLAAWQTAAGGAINFEGSMIEELHIQQAKAILKGGSHGTE